MEYQLIPKQLFSGNITKNEINEELLCLFIQNILKLDTSNANMTKYKEKFINLRKSLSIKARALTKSIIIQETSK